MKRASKRFVDYLPLSWTLNNPQSDIFYPINLSCGGKYLYSVYVIDPIGYESDLALIVDHRSKCRSMNKIGYKKGRNYSKLDTMVFERYFVDIFRSQGRHLQKVSIDTKYRSTRRCKMALKGHENCIRKGEVEPGYVYRKKMIYSYGYINPIEDAKELARIKSEGGHSAEEMEALGYGSAALVGFKISLLKLPKIIQGWIAEGRLKATIGFQLYSVKNDSLRISLARRAMTERLSVSAVKRIMKDMRDKGLYTNQAVGARMR